MKAIVQYRYGGPEVLQLAEVPPPAVAEDGILVRVHASTVTLADVAFRKADPFIVRFFAGFTRPTNPVGGTEFSGVVERTGGKVTRFRVGDEVFGASAGFGAFAEYLAIPETGAIGLKPRGVDHSEAVGMMAGFLTAMPFLRDGGGIKAGDTVLINGASGSVGSMAVQVAKHLGAHVTGVCSTRNVELVASLGADRVIDYTREDFTTARGAYDIIFDAVGTSSFARCRAALKPQGRYLTTVPSFAILLQMLMTRRSKGQRAALMTTGLRKPAERVRDLELLAQLVEAGVLRPVIGNRFPMDRIADAHRLVETHHKVGDTILEMIPAASAVSATKGRSEPAPAI
jgi:NADPH:quinone reductase-like Zn-dependent oxidoreductase